MDWDTSPSLPIPLDILFDVLLELPIHGILALRCTSKSLCAVTHLRTLWALLFRRRIVDQRIPCPHTDSIADLSASELEDLTLRALTLHRNWTSPRPVPHRKLTFNTHSEPDSRVVFLQFLPGRAHRWLISVRMTTRPWRYLLQCWDVASDQPRCVAELMHADGPYGGVILNSDPNSSAVLAFQSAQTETFSIDFDAEDPESAFETEGIIDGIRELHLLSGATLVTRSIDEGRPLCLWDLDGLQQEKLQLFNPSLIQPDDRIQAIHLAHDYALVVRLHSIEIYNTTPRPGILPVRGAPIAYPLTQFKFRWRTDTVVLCEQGPPSPLSPIHLLVRFGSTYPWPVNVLHHYILRPNPAYLVGPTRTHSTPTTPSSPISHGAPSSSSHSPSTPSSVHSVLSPCTSTTEYNLPYILPPTLTHTIGSPVRLFSQASMTLGQYGTALWIDSDAEARGGPGERGQRVAGRMVRSEQDPGVNVESGNGNGSGNKPQEPDGAESCGASMVFGVCDDDAWRCVAMDEDAGRIAIGHNDGAITLLEY